MRGQALFDQPGEAGVFSRSQLLGFFAQVVVDLNIHLEAVCVMELTAQLLQVLGHGIEFGVRAHRPSLGQASLYHAIPATPVIFLITEGTCERNETVITCVVVALLAKVGA